MGESGGRRREVGEQSVLTGARAWRVRLVTAGSAGGVGTGGMGKRGRAEDKGKPGVDELKG